MDKNHIIEAPKFINLLVFEIKSLLGRYFKKHSNKIKILKSPALLDLGCGNNFTDGWIHVDFYLFQFKFWKKYRLPEVQADFRYPLNCHDNIIDGVYCGHTLEHLYPDQAYNFLNEIYRVLKPQSWLRINVPDLKVAVDFYNGKIDLPEYKYKVEAIANLTQNSGHCSVWDSELLYVALENTGFVNIREVEFGREGMDIRLI